MARAENLFSTHTPPPGPLRLCVLGPCLSLSSSLPLALTLSPSVLLCQSFLCPCGVLCVCACVCVCAYVCACMSLSLSLPFALPSTYIRFFPEKTTGRDHVCVRTARVRTYMQLVLRHAASGAHTHTHAHIHAWLSPGVRVCVWRGCSGARDSRGLARSRELRGTCLGLLQEQTHQ